MAKIEKLVLIMEVHTKNKRGEEDKNKGREEFSRPLGTYFLRRKAEL